MNNRTTSNTLAHPFWPVKSSVNIQGLLSVHQLSTTQRASANANPSSAPKAATIMKKLINPANSCHSIQLPLFPDSVRHHKVTLSRKGKRILSYSRYKGKPYGVSSSHKVLTKGLLIKKWDLVRTFLRVGCNLTTKEVAVALVLLRLQAYYPQVYPKASQVAQEAYVGKATFWRTVGKLRDMNLLEVVNQFVIRVEAQISNLYLLNKFLIAIAKYLAEHIAHVWPDWLEPYLRQPWPQFWSFLAQGQVARSGPLIPA